MPLLDHILPEPNPPLSPERVELVRAMYREGFTVSRILALGQMSLGTLYKCLDGAPFGPEGLRWPPIPRRNPAKKPRRVSPADTSSLGVRLLRVGERMVREVELRLGRDDIPGPERERDSRILLQVMRALRVVQAADLETAPRRRVEETMTPEEDAALRAELFRRLEAMRASARGE
jgi:hypothetical protein